MMLNFLTIIVDLIISKIIKIMFNMLFMFKTHIKCKENQNINQNKKY